MSTLTPIKHAPIELITSTYKKETCVVDERIVKIINGHSPIVSERGTWLVFDDGSQQYIDTNVSVNRDSEIDPTVPDWAKKPVKPSYSCDEVGAVDADNALSLKEIDDMFMDI